MHTARTTSAELRSTLTDTHVPVAGLILGSTGIGTANNIGFVTIENEDRCNELHRLVGGDPGGIAIRLCEHSCPKASLIVLYPSPLSQQTGASIRVNEVRVVFGAGRETGKTL